MRKIVLMCFLVANSFVVFGQNEFVLPTAPAKVSVAKSVTGLQIGLFGTEFYNEAKLSERFTFRSQFNLDMALWGGDFYEKTGFSLIPSFSVQPKYYYNIVKRGEKKGRNITNNGANYVSLQVKYFPDWFVISNYDNFRVRSQISFIPTYGIRRNFAKKFNYEFKVGLGWGYIFDSQYFGEVFDLGFKIGYDF